MLKAEVCQCRRAVRVDAKSRAVEAIEAPPRATAEASAMLLRQKPGHTLFPSIPSDRHAISSKQLLP